MPIDEMDNVRGYTIYRNRVVVPTDQEGRQPIDRFHLEDPKTRRTIRQAMNIDELRALARSLPQAYARIGGKLLQLTHDRGTPRDIVVNVFNAEDGSLAGIGVGRLPWAASAEQIRAAFDRVGFNATADEVADLATLCRTPPVELPDDEEQA